MDKNMDNVFNNLPNQKVPGACFNGVTNVCELRNKVSPKGREKICHQCQKSLLETINDPILENMTLHKFLTLSIEDRWEFIIKHKIWRNRLVGKYTPEKTNKFAQSRSMISLEREDLTAGEIYFTFKKYIDYLKSKYTKNRGLINIQIKEDSLLSLIESEKQISEYFNYNTNNRDSSEKGFDFKIVTERPENTTFKESLNYGDISDIYLINHEGLHIPINKFPLLTIKNKNYNKLSEQIKNYINNPEFFKKDLNTSFSINKPNLLAYLYIVEQIEGACESNEEQAKSYVQPIFQSRKNERENKMKKIITTNNEQDANWNFEIAPQKRISRAVEKIIITHDGDLSKSTDNCRGTIVFKTVGDLQKGMVVFMDCLKEYNKSQNDETKKVSEIYFEDKFGNLVDFSKKSSGYRDGKFLIKMGDGNVIELMLQLEDMYLAKNEGFDYIYKKSMPHIITKLNFTKDEIEKINHIIDDIDPTMSKRGKKFFDTTTNSYKIPHIEDFKHGDKIPADLIYNIYRNLQEYDRILDRQGKKTLPFDKSINERGIVEKLQFLEREIYQRGYKQHSCKINKRVTEKQYQEANLPLKKKLQK